MKRLKCILISTLLGLTFTASPVEAGKPRVQGTCSNPWFDAAAAYAGWPEEEISKVGEIAFRESRCRETARNRCCSGLMQIHRAWLRQLGLKRSDLYDGQTNLAAAYYVWSVSGWNAWKL